MKRNRMIHILFLSVCCVILAGVSYVIGYKTAYDRIENATPSLDSQTFYATISSIRDGNLTVKGMDVNDINCRGNFVFSIAEETKIVWRYTDIKMEDLDVGDKIAVTYTGQVMETDPAQIVHVEKIQLLDDELSEAETGSAEMEQALNDNAIVIGDMSLSIYENIQTILKKLEEAGLNYTELETDDSENKYDSFYGVAGWLQMYFLEDECVRLRLISTDSLNDLAEIPQTARGLQPYSTSSQMMELYGDSFETHTYAGKQIYKIYRYTVDDCIIEFGIPGEDRDSIYNIDIYDSSQAPIYQYGEEINKAN